MSVRIKRVHDPATTADVLRVLVDRLWPRCLTKEAALDAAAELATLVRRGRGTLLFASRELVHNDANAPQLILASRRRSAASRPG